MEENLSIKDTSSFFKGQPVNKNYFSSIPNTVLLIQVFKVHVVFINLLSLKNYLQLLKYTWLQTEEKLNLLTDSVLKHIDRLLLPFLFTYHKGKCCLKGKVFIENKYIIQMLMISKFQNININKWAQKTKQLSRDKYLKV